MSKHREFLRWIPLHNITPSLVHQRRSILYGARARETPEDLCEREMRREIRAVLPLVFGGVLSFSGTVALVHVGNWSRDTSLYVHFFIGLARQYSHSCPCSAFRASQNVQRMASSKLQEICQLVSRYFRSSVHTLTLAGLINLTKRSFFRHTVW